jgi:hypothetical protein
MNLSSPCVAATTEKSTITAMKPHGGRRLVLSRQGRPESYGSKLTYPRLLHNGGSPDSPQRPRRSSASVSRDGVFGQHCSLSGQTRQSRLRAR